MKRKNDIKSKMDRNQSRIDRKKINESGSGLFLFRNKSETATIQLFKKSQEGKIWIEPKQTWTGDSSFFRMIPREASLVKTIESPQKDNKISTEEKVEEKIESQEVNKEVKKKATKKVVKKKTRTKSKTNKEKSVMNEQKLLLDQPDQINEEGKVEHVMKQTPKSKQIKEVKNDNESESVKESLLTEDPLSGVTIINE